MTNPLSDDEQDMLWGIAAQNLADRTGTTLEDAYDQLRRYHYDGRLAFHGDVNRVYLSADGHQIADANPDMLRLAATPSNDKRIVAAMSDWIRSLSPSPGGGTTDMSREAEERIHALLDELDQGDELDRNQARVARELKSMVREDLRTIPDQGSPQNE